MNDEIDDVIKELELLASKTDQDFNKKFWGCYEEYLDQYNTLLSKIQVIGLFQDYQQIIKVPQEQKTVYGAIGTQAEQAKLREITNSSQNLLRKLKKHQNNKNKNIFHTKKVGRIVDVFHSLLTENKPLGILMMIIFLLGSLITIVGFVSQFGQTDWPSIPTDWSSIPTNSPTISDLAISPINVEQVILLKQEKVDSSVYQVAWSMDGNLLAVAASSVYFYDTQTFPQNREIDTEGWVNSIAFSPDGVALASASNKELKLWDVATGGELLTFDDITSPKSVTFSPNGTKIAVAVGKTVKVLDVAGGHVLHTLICGSEVETVAFSPDGQTLASGSNSGELKLWDVANENELYSLKHNIYLKCVAFSPDEEMLASGALSNTIKLWNVTNGYYMGPLNKHNDTIESVAFSPNGQLLASASQDLTVKLWDVASRSELRTLKGHTDWVESVAFSPDGELLASGSIDGTIRLWGITS